MAINTFTNYSTPGYSGYQKYGLNNISVARKVILLPPGTTITDKTAAALLATWTTLTKNAIQNRIHPFPLALEVKREGESTIMEKAPLSGDIPVREDATTLKFTYNVNQILASYLRKFNFKQWDVCFVDGFNNIMGWTPDGTKFKGLTTTSVHFGQMVYSDGSKSRTNELSIALPNPTEWNDAPALILGAGLTWFPLNLDGTTGVKMTVFNSSIAGFTVAVNAAGLDLTDPAGAFIGLAKADFILKKAGVVQSLSAATMTDNGDGTYSFATTLISGSFTVELVGPPSAISIAAYNIESVAPGSFTF